MKLQGLHHVTMITADAQANVDFYADLLGLRLVKKTVNFDAPDAYHLYFGDESGSPGSLLTWFEFPDAARGRAGAGMIHTLQLAVAGPAALDFWAQRLESHRADSTRTDANIRFADPDGLALELVTGGEDAPLRAGHPQIPAEHALMGVLGARAYQRTEQDRTLLTETLGFTASGTDDYVLEGEQRRFRWSYDRAAEAGTQGAGTVHHIAWHSRDEDHTAWQSEVARAGRQVTPVIDRDYFLSIYFRMPGGVLFEIATTSPGFAVDEDPEHLGEELKLPRQHEHLRSQLEQILTPVSNPRARV